ncbi:unnamed protein product [Adineta ricciae]|uniref:Uncharacterized protein n=1 Tax=Adineta ricciae TaxID=249248 RepID=A0A814B2V4_ADIRI|nr:unnamed protein product [Adineta ricciae]
MNKQSSRQQQAQAQPPPPPPPPPAPQPPPPASTAEPPNNDGQFGDASSYLQFQQSTYFPNNPSMDHQQDQLFATDDQTKSYFSFFDRFGEHDLVRARLNNDLKREYNDYLHSLQNMARNKTAQMSVMATPRGTTTRRVQFQQGHSVSGSKDQRAIHNAHSMNDISSSQTIQNSQSMSDLSSGSSMHNVHSMHDLSTTATSELAANRARARSLQQHSEQYIRDREAYILELYEQIYELEARIRQLEGEARKLTVHNSTKETRERYTQDLNALNALLAERLNQRVAVDYELAQILNRPPVPYTSGGRVVVTGTSNMNMPLPQMTPRPVDSLQLGQQTSRSTEQISSQSRRVQESQQFQSPRTPRDPNRPQSPNYARGSIFNGIYGTFKTEEQIRKQERYRLDLLQQIEEKRLRDAAEAARRKAEEERERLRQLQYEQQLARQLAEEALRKQQAEEEERRRLLALEEEAERKRREEELERQRQEDEADRLRRQEELARQRKEDEAERLKRLAEIERLRKEEEAERLRKRTEIERTRKQEDLERLRRKEEEEERRRREFEEERKRRDIEEERRRREEEEDRRKREEEEERRRRLIEEEEERRRIRRLEEEDEERRRRNAKVVRPASPSMPRESSDSDVLQRLMQLKRQLREKENRLRDTIQEETTTTRTRIVDYSSPPYLPPPQPFYVQRRESSDDLLDVARIHYRDAPLTHDILLNILKTAEGDEANPSYIRDDSVMMQGVAGGKRITSAEFLSVPKPPGISDELFNSSSIESLAGRRRYGNSLPAFYDNIDSLEMADKELNRIAKKSDHRVSKLRHIELDDGQGLDTEDILERFEEKSRLQGLGRQSTVHDDAWLK